MNSAKFKHLDPYLLSLSLAATLLGLLFILDAGYARSLQVGRGYFPPEFKSQSMFLVLSVPVFLFASRIDPKKWFDWAKPIWVLSVLSLIAVEVIGTEFNGAQRWLSLGPINIQPAEFAKLTTVLYLASVFAFRKEWKTPAKGVVQWLDHALLPKVKRALPAFFVLFAVFLIEKEPDLGTGAVVAATAFAMFVPGGVSWKSICLALLGALAFAGLMVMKEPYRWDRVSNHVHRWAAKNVDDVAYQTVQSESAMASGGIVGVGIGAGRAKHVMPATTTDFIMATVAEEFGLLGALLTLGVVGAISWRLIALAQRASSKFRMLVLFGVAAWIGIQTCVNVMMANGFLPAIGIPLPFISSGGSSLVALWLALGMCNSMLLPQKEGDSGDESSRHRRGHRRPHLPRAHRRRRAQSPASGPDVPRIPAGARS